MNGKSILFLVLMLCSFIFVSYVKADDEKSVWDTYMDVYSSDGLDRPVNAIEYKKTMDKLQDLKNKHNKRKRLKKDEMPEPMTKGEPIKEEKHDIIKVTTPLYYDGKTVPVGFYKILCKNEENGDYYLHLVQGKTSIIRIKANKVSHQDFCPEEINCIETKDYQDKYFKINYKTIDYAVTGYLFKITQ